MKQRYHLFTRGNGVFYSLDTITNKQKSLQTKDAQEAQRFLNALNEACQQPAINLQIAQVYLQHSDPESAKRTWLHVIDEMGKAKTGSTKKRWDTAMEDSATQRAPSLPQSARNIPNGKSVIWSRATSKRSRKARSKCSN